MTTESAAEPSAFSPARMLGIERGELAAVSWSFAYFFSLLAGYFMLRPVREAIAIVSGVQTIPWLFTGTFVVTLLVTPVFGWITSRFARKAFLPWLYYFSIVNMGLFYIAFTSMPEGSEALAWVARAFFVWISVFNLFIVSVFWSFMADIYSREQSRRLFGLISAGGSAGSILGPLLTGALVTQIGYQNILPISAGLLFFATICVRQLRQWVIQTEAPNSASIASDEGLGGSALAGIKFTFSSRYFGAIAGGLLIANFMGGTLYYFMADVVGETFADNDRRVQVFAWMNSAIGFFAFLGQLFLVRVAVRKLGIGWTLAILPLVSLVGFAALAYFALTPALAAIFPVIALLNVVRRSVGFGLTKPTNDMLYGVVSAEEKYKAKNFIDTAIYRASDVVTAWSVRSLGGMVGLAGVSIICLPLAVIWIAVAFWIGRQYREKDAALESPAA